MTAQQQRHMMQFRIVSPEDGMRIRSCRVMRIPGYFESVGSKKLIKSYSLVLCTDFAMILQQTAAEAEVVRMVEAQLPWVKSRYVVRPDD